MRFLTYNIHGSVGAWGRFDPAAIIAIIEEIDADVVALQEVHDDDERDRSFLTALQSLDYEEVIYGPTMRNPKGHYGNVLMTKSPARLVERIDLSRGVWEPRGAIRAVVESENLVVDLLATHLGLISRERCAQLKQLLSKQDEDSGADLRILMGDLNIWNPMSKESRFLRERFGGIKQPRTFPAAFPFFRLDRIHMLPATVSYRVEAVRSNLARTSSDHLPLLVEIRKF